MIRAVFFLMPGALLCGLRNRSLALVFDLSDRIGEKAF